MYKNIKYKGISVNKSDYECQDGELSNTTDIESGLIGLRVPLLPEGITSLEVDEKIVFLHKTHEYTHYIVQKGKDLYWMQKNKDGTFGRNELKVGMTAKKISAVGNTLVVLTDKGLYYFLWEFSDAAGIGGGYVDLGTMPSCEIEFRLEAKLAKAEIGLIEPIWTDGTKSKLTITEADKQHVFAVVNKLIADESINKGRFIFPFLVRYAFRLYDGSLAEHSAPVLMMTSDLLTPCILGRWDLGGIKPTANVASHKLMYRGNMSDDVLKKWSDIIKSVEIFISAPIYTYDQNGELQISQPYTIEEKPLVRSTAQIPLAMKSISVCKMDNSGVHEANRNHPWTNWCYARSFRDMYCLTNYDLSNAGTPDDKFYLSLEEPIKVPIIDRGKVMKKIADTHDFFLLKSIPTDTFNNGDFFFDMNIPSDYLQSLTSREVMSDSYNSRSTLIPKTMFTYNNQLNIANVNRYFYKGHAASSAIQNAEGYMLYTLNNRMLRIFRYPTGFPPSGSKPLFAHIRVYVYIRKSGKEFVVKSDDAICGWYTPVFYFYYPDKEAYKAVVSVKAENDTEWKQYTLALKPHSFLDGAVFCDKPTLERDVFDYYDWVVPEGESDERIKWENWCRKAVVNGNTPPGEAVPTPTELDKCFVSLPNKIYTSNVYNPFFFPLVGINTVGSGEIIGLAAATKALSEGQFGQFPMYAFTTEGVWALSLTEEGGFSSVQPVTRDVCLSEDAITSADTSVLFLTKRGLMLLSGSKTLCLSDDLKANTFVNDSSFPAYLKVLETQGITNVNNNEEFIKYITNAGVMYDYLNRRIIVYNKDENTYDFAYVYDIDMENWGKMSCQIKYHINSYPDSYAVIKRTNSNMLVNFSNLVGEGSLIERPCAFITRPLKLDHPDVLKTVRTCIQNGRFNANEVKQILFGSNDLIHWFVVRSSDNARMTGFSGTPYKFFVMAAIAQLGYDEFIHGCTIEYEPKLMNKLR